MKPRGPAWLGCIYALAERITSDDFDEAERAEWPDSDAKYWFGAVSVHALTCQSASEAYAGEAAPSDYLDAAEYLLQLAMADSASGKEERMFSRLIDDLRKARAIASTTPETRR